MAIEALRARRKAFLLSESRRMMRRRAHSAKRSFTLVEVLVGIMIIALIGVASYQSFFALSAANIMSQNRANATAMAQAAIEEVRAVARANFRPFSSPQTAATIVFPQINQIRFPGFTRQITITSVNPMLAQADVTIFWNDRFAQAGNANPLQRQYHLSQPIAEPPAPLPGNIRGIVTHATTGAPVVNVPVIATPLSLAGQPEGTNSATTTQQQIGGAGTYTFVNSSSRAFQLRAGNWRVQVVGAAGFYDSVPQLGFVGSGQELEINFQLTPLPAPGFIQGSFVDVSNGANINNIGVYVNENNQRIYNGNNGGAGFNFQINFQNTNPRSFTVFTWDTYAQRYCGNFFDYYNLGRQFHHLGWSSAPVQNDGVTVINRTNPWGGNALTDRIQVTPGQIVNLGAIPLSPVPRGRLTGTVTDQGGQPVAGATVNVLWNVWGVSWGQTTSAADGSYALDIPAAQEMFPANDQNYRVRAQASSQMNFIACCDEPGSGNVVSPQAVLGPVFTGDVLTRNFVLPVNQNTLCGNADGFVRDARTQAALPAATVELYGICLTDANGYYLFRCAAGQRPDACRIPQGDYRVVVRRTGYYDFNSDGNIWYLRRGPIHITTNQTVRYADLFLVPQGTGTVTGRVVQPTANGPLPLAGVTVDLYYYGGQWRESRVTDSEGRFTFNSVLETWPSVFARSNPGAYPQGSYQHFFKAGFRPARVEYSTAQTPAFTLDAGETKDMGDIILQLAGQM